MSLNSVLWQSFFLSVHVPKFTSRIIFLPAQEARTFLWSIFLNIIWLCLYKYYKSIELFILHSLQLKICIRPMSHAMMPMQWWNTFSLSQAETVGWGSVNKVTWAVTWLHGIIWLLLGWYSVIIAWLLPSWNLTDECKQYLFDDFYHRRKILLG